MADRTSIKLRRRFNTLNSGLVDVIRAVVWIVAHQIVDIVAIRTHTPAHWPRQTFKAAFPLLALFRLQVWVAILLTMDLAHGWCFIRSAVRSDNAIAFDKFPRGAGLPGAVIAKVRVIVVTRSRFKRDAIKLLHRGEEHASVALFKAIFQASRPRFGFLFLPVQTCTDIAVANGEGIHPLRGVLFHIIHAGGCRIAPFARIVVQIFAATITRHQLRLINALVIAQPGVPVLAIQLTGVRRTGHVEVIVIAIIAVIGGTVVIAKATEETAHAVSDLLLHGAVQRLTHKTIAIRLTRCVLRIDIKTTGIGIVTRQSDFGFIEYLLE
ncbi:hypothetical protein D3C76_805120 [compost metagenome]